MAFVSAAIYNSYKVTHIQGKDNSADILSRLPVGPAQLTDAIATKVYACSLASEAIPSVLTPKEVELASERDPTLKLVREAVTSGDWSRLSGTMYKALSDEIWVLGQIVMRGNRIILPESLWKQTLPLAHEGHQGITRTKARLREKVWWPNMDKQVEQLVKACYQCQLVGPRTKVIKHQNPYDPQNYPKDFGTTLQLISLKSQASTTS